METQSFFFNLIFEIIINVFVRFSASLEYLCYGSTVIINILIFQRGDRPRRHNLMTMIMTSKVGPRTERVDCVNRNVVI